MPRAKDILRLPEVWSRLAKGTPDSLTKASTSKSRAYLLRRQRWMDLLVAFGAQDEAAKLLNPGNRKNRPAVTVMLSTHGDAHHVFVARDDHEETVLEFADVGTPCFDLQTGLETGKLSTVEGEQSRARQTAEGLAAYYGVPLIVTKGSEG